MVQDGKGWNMMVQWELRGRWVPAHPFSREEILFNWKVFQRDSLFLQELQTRIKPRSMIELLSDQLARLSGLFSILIFDNFKYFIIILGLAATRYRTVPSKPRVPNWINNTHPKPGEFRRIFNPHRIFFLIEFLERRSMNGELSTLNSYMMDSQALNSHELSYTLNFHTKNSPTLASRNMIASLQLMPAIYGQ